MLGVVLWSDPSDGKAVFWCEDQGDLAYYDGISDGVHVDAMFEAGDMVQFQVTTHQRVRKAHDAHLVQEQGYAGLPETLRQSTAPAPESPQSAEIIPFALNEAPRIAPRKQARKA